MHWKVAATILAIFALPCEAMWCVSGDADPSCTSTCPSCGSKGKCNPDAGCVCFQSQKRSLSCTVSCACQNNAACNMFSGVCYCVPNTWGTSCEYTCPAWDSYTFEVCNNHGLCLGQGTSSPLCVCIGGFTGQNCSIPVTPSLTSSPTLTPTSSHTHSPSSQSVSLQMLVSPSPSRAQSITLPANTSETWTRTLTPTARASSSTEIRGETTSDSFQRVPQFLVRGLKYGFARKNLLGVGLCRRPRRSVLLAKGSRLFNLSSPWTLTMGSMITVALLYWSLLSV